MTEFSEVLILFVTMFVMVVGLILTVVPPIPGTLIIWGAAIFYGWVLGWENLGWTTFVVLTVLMIIGLVIDVLAGHFGAKLGGASCLAIIVGAVLGLILGIVASLIGTPILGCFAGVVGIFVGVLLVEWLRKGEWRTAFKATQGYVAGSVAGVMARATSGVLMVGIFLIRVYWGG